MSLKLSQHQFIAMGGPCELKLYLTEKQQPLLKKLEDEVRRIEKKYSRYLDDSVISKINNSYCQPITVDDETAGLLNYAQSCFEISEGLFDITSGILRQAWNFKKKTIPDQNQLDQLLNNIGWERVRWDGKAITLENNMEIDFGGVGKEYAVDVLARMCEQSGVCAGLINLSGDIRVVGPHPDGSPWQIGIQHPRKNNKAIATISINEGALTTSGDYERFIIVDGQRYYHILNPKTGWPVHGAAAVSVQADECLVAGSMSTIAMLKDEPGAKKWLGETGCEYLLVDKELNVFSS